jgi:hypothetical protein
MTVSNSDSKTYEQSFNASWQNIVKNDNDRTSVTFQQLTAKANVNTLQIIKPIVCIDDGNEAEFTIPVYYPGINAGKEGVLYFGYSFTGTGTVERNNLGTELLSTAQFSGNATIPLNREITLGSWESEREVKETIGVPFLSEIPILKYFFSTTTTSREKSLFLLTVRAGIADTAEHRVNLTGKKGL